MTRKSIYFILMFILTFHMTYLYANVEKDSKITKNIYIITGIRIDNLYKMPEIKEITTKIKPWVEGQASLPDSEYPSEEKKKQIKGTSSVIMDIKLLSGLSGHICIAKFNSQEDAILGYKDSVPMSFAQWTLLSGETIENAIVSTSKISNKTVVAYLIYKNFVFQLFIGRGKGEELKKEDYIFIDSFIKFFKTIIDDSLTPEKLISFKTPIGGMNTVDVFRGINKFCDTEIFPDRSIMLTNLTIEIEINNLTQVEAMKKIINEYNATAKKLKYEYLEIMYNYFKEEDRYVISRVSYLWQH